MSNRYDNLSSKVKRLYIPLPHYKFFHQPSSVDATDEHFVGRKSIIEKLTSWLKYSKKNPTGSYLITGYRGMGKSSFVGRCVSQLVDNHRGVGKFPIMVKRIVQYVAIVFIFMSITLYHFRENTVNNHFLLIALIAWCVVLITLLITELIGKRHIYHLNLNLGNEIHDERDVLALIAESIRIKFKEYQSKYYPFTSVLVFCRALGASMIPLFAWWLYNQFTTLKNIIEEGFIKDKSLADRFLLFIEQMLVKIIGGNYFLKVILALIIAYLLYQLFVRLLLYGLGKIGLKHYIVTTKDILSQLDKCCERINSFVDEENEINGTADTSFVGMAFNRRKTRKHQIATVLELEQELVEFTRLFKDSWLVRVQLIIVLDELDKVIVRTNEIHPTNTELPKFAYDSGFPGGGSPRDKKQNVLHLLAKLKFFISNANAKFVFISGRELYDAYLADVSDREFAISSIFNGVINVDSFLSFNSQTKDITKLTEMYLCKQLRTEPLKEERKNFKPEEYYSLQGYRKNLETALPGELSEKELKEIEKVTIFLKQFVTDLTFVSNGAPKKLTTHFEKRVITKAQYENELEKDRSGHLDIFKTLDKEEAPYYLAFGYYDQQQTGFLHYMAYPIFQTIISPASEYGDKLLVAALFLVSHIYKHHSGGFSWRNLEYIPELIESNKTPELRDFINSIISYLSQIHLTQITSGLYHYKFPMKLYEEISTFSKKSEQISAIFNFSRDDSRAVKQYFADMIEYHTKRTDEYSRAVLANLHHSLGDQYLASEEYTEAINQFRIAKDLITKEFESKGGFNENRNAPLIARLVMVMLKIGLAYEKRNTIDSAYLTYNEIVNLLISNRHIDEEKFGLEYRLEKHEDSWAGNKILLFKGESMLTRKEDAFHKTVHPIFMQAGEKRRHINYWSYNDELVTNLAHHLSSEKSYLISKLSMYEDLRIIYLALLAKLFAIEKQNISGITLSNVAVTESEFRYLFLVTNNKEKYLLSADFFRKLGDILYYKNSDFNFNPNNLLELLDVWGYDMYPDIFDYCHNEKKGKEEYISIQEALKKFKIDNLLDREKLEVLKKVIFTSMSAGGSKRKRITALLYLFKKKVTDKEFRTVEKFFDSLYFKVPSITLSRVNTIHDCLDRERNAPCYACKYYNRSLSILAQQMLSPDELKKDRSKAISFLVAIKSKDPNLRENNLNHVALSLESMGNVMLCCAGQKNTLRIEFLHAVSNFYQSGHGLPRIAKLRLNQLEKTVLYYAVAAEYHKLATNNRQAIQCYVKIFNLLVSYIVNTSEENTAEANLGKLITQLGGTMLTDAIRCAYSNRDFRNLIDMSEFEKIETHLGNTSIMPDIEEVILAYYKIRIELCRKGVMSFSEIREDVSMIYQSRALNYLRLESLTYTRIISLLFKANLNDLILHQMLKIDKSNIFFTTYKEQFQKIDPNFEMIINISLNDKHDTFEAIEFLIADSIFCLTNIIGFLTTASRSTLFTNSFCSDVYKNLLKWNKIKEYYMATYSNRDKEFKTYLEDKISKEICNKLLRITYLAEMSLKYYQRAIEMNSEGSSYQEFIREMNLVDDDLQNDTCQFYLALERYKFNMGAYKKYDETVSKYAEKVPITESRCYQGVNYFEERQKSEK